MTDPWDGGQLGRKSDATPGESENPLDANPVQNPAAPPAAAEEGFTSEGAVPGPGSEHRPAPAQVPAPAPPPAAHPAVQARVRPRTLFVARLLQALWLGGGTFLMFLAAPAVFRSAESPGQAATIVGAMLTRWHYLALLFPALLIIIEWHRMRPRVITILFVAVIAAALQSAADLRIRAIRQMSIVPISSLADTDPLRRQFGLLHGISSLLLLAQVVCAVASIAVEPDQD